MVAEIPGAGKDEIVTGGPSDSWHGGTGATDDAAGCAVMIEVVRILKALGLNMDRPCACALERRRTGFARLKAYVKDTSPTPR
jgi:Zn-dependent M28 family amino/carboxypeptidase